LNVLQEIWDFMNLPVGEAVDRMYHTKSKPWVAQFAPAGSAPGVAATTQNALRPDQDYLTVTVQKTVLPYDRIAFKTFYGVVHSSILLREGDGEPRSITAFMGLDPALTALDKRAGEAVVMGPRTLLELAPFKGVAIAATIALLAIEARDYAKPLLSTLQKLSAIAGVKYFAPAKGVVDALIVGVRLLAETAGGGGVQVAYAGNVPRTTGVFLVAATETGPFKWPDHTLGADYTLLRRGKPVQDFAYMVLTIEASQERSDWREIPALKEMETALDAAVRAGGAELAQADSKAVQKVREALVMLEWACLNCPELCSADGERIANLCRAKVNNILARAQAKLTAAGDRVAPPAEPRFTLEEIDAFPRPR